MTDEYCFICSHCGIKVKNDSLSGTKNRNHCPKCLFSLHVDDKKSGDRMSNCKGEMEPIGLTYKNEGVDKYGKARQGELMLIHQCTKCNKISINRIAGDDDAKEILKVYEQSKNNTDLRQILAKQNIVLLSENDLAEVDKQLFGE